MLKKLTIEFIQSEFENEDYVLLTKKYINAHQKLDYICPKKHKHSISWSNWQKGKKCPYCANRRPIDIKFVRESFIKEDYILLTTEYKNNRQKLDYICPNGHKHSINWNNWQQGKRCPHCTGNNKPTIEFIISEFKKENYVLLTTEYINNRQKLNYICPRGHKHNITWHNWTQNQRCPYCFGNISKSEIQVRNFIESLGIKVSPNDRNQIFNPETGNGLELDIFLPTLNKAIEYNGEYWHQDKNRDILKQKLCESKGIDLLTIWDRKWKISGEKCKNKIKKFIFKHKIK